MIVTLECFTIVNRAQHCTISKCCNNDVIMLMRMCWFSIVVDVYLLYDQSYNTALQYVVIFFACVILLMCETIFNMDYYNSTLIMQCCGTALDCKILARNYT